MLYNHYMRRKLQKKNHPFHLNLHFFDRKNFFTSKKDEAFATPIINRKIRLENKHDKLLFGFFLLSLVIFAGSMVLFIEKPFLISRLPEQKAKPIITSFVEDTSINMIVSKLQTKNITLQDIHLDPDGSTVTGRTDPDGILVYFDRYNIVDWQVDSLQQILSRLTIDNKKPTAIDLRYNKPIVRY